MPCRRPGMTTAAQNFTAPSLINMILNFYRPMQKYPWRDILHFMTFSRAEMSYTEEITYICLKKNWRDPTQMDWINGSRHEQWQIWESMPMPMFFGGTIFNANVNANVSLGRLFNGNANVNSFSSALSIPMSMAMSDTLTQCQ